MAEVVSVSEKAGCTRQMSAGKTNVSEPLRRVENSMNAIETGLVLLARDMSSEEAC